MKLLKSEDYIDCNTLDLTTDELKFICCCLKRYNSMSDALCSSKVTSLFASKKQIDKVHDETLKINLLVSKISRFLDK